MSTAHHTPKLFDTSHMDEYTKSTIAWLNKRFEQVDADGIYFAHQPIYGFRQGHSEIGLFVRYIRTYQIMRALSHFNFDSFLDAGGAEGYKSYVVKQLFQANVMTTDLAESACQRAREIFNIQAQAADIHHLPFDDNSFDMVLSSETIEHVADYQKAAAELLRVAKKGVVITVPHESEEHLESEDHVKLPADHQNVFDLHSFDYLKKEGYDVIARPIISTLMYGPEFILEGMRIPLPEEVPAHLMEFMPYAYHDNINKIRPFVWPYNNFAAPLIRALVPASVASAIIKFDDWLCPVTPGHMALAFTIIKDKNAYHAQPAKPISPRQIIDVQVPLHKLNRSTL